MKKISNFLSAFLFLLANSIFFTPYSSYCQEADAKEKLNTFLNVAEDLFNKTELPGAGIAIVYEGEVVYKGGFGFADLDKKEPVSEHTLFFIGSTTKAFTGVATAKLVENQLLDWKKPIINYLPDFTLSEPYIAKHIHLEDLFIHMSGLSRKDELWYNKDITREQVYKQTSTLPFAHSFRSTWDYNNHAYVIIGKVMEKVTGKTWESLIQDEIFNPLGMTNSYVRHQDFINYNNHVTGYFGDGKTIRAHISSDNVAPAGAISSTPKDISKWLQMLANQGMFKGEKFISQKEFDYLTKPKGMSFVDTCSVHYYSIGWGGLINEYQRTLRHSGAIAGNNARVSVMPDDGFGIFIMTNQRSDYKDLLTDYAESIFVNGDFKRDVEKENKVISLNRFIQFQNKLLDTGIEVAKAYHATIKYKDFESNMIALGNSLLDAGHIESAVFVLELNVANNSESYLAYDNYAQALFQNNNKDKAIEMYKKSLELFPNNVVTKMKLKKLLEN